MIWLHLELQLLQILSLLMLKCVF